MNRRNFLVTAGASGMGLVAATGAQAQLRRRGLRSVPVSPVPQPVSPLLQPEVGALHLYLSISIVAVSANGVPQDMSEGDVTVYVGDTIVVRTSITDRASSGQIINPGIISSCAGGWPFVDSDSLWKLVWDHYMIAGTGQTLIVEDPQKPTDPPAEIILNVIPR